MKANDKYFIRGYACAVATLIHNHGAGTEADELIKTGGLTVAECKKAEVDDFDMQSLLPELKRIEKDG